MNKAYNLQQVNSHQRIADMNLKMAGRTEGTWSKGFWLRQAAEQYVLAGLPAMAQNCLDEANRIDPPPTAWRNFVRNIKRIFRRLK